jgi:hypothetical protein
MSRPHPHPPNKERAMVVLFPLITLSLFLFAIVIGWVMTSVLPALKIIGKA